MRNTGNSCYFNAVVQSLLSLRTFSFDLIEPAMLASIEQLTSGTEGIRNFNSATLVQLYLP